MSDDTAGTQLLFYGYQYLIPTLYELILVVDERGMRPSVTATGAIDLPPTYSDCVNETGTPKVGKRGDVHTITEESLDDTDGDVSTADDEGPPLSPPPAYESVALSEEDEDGISFQVTGSALPDVVNQDRVPQRLTSNHLDTEV